MPPPQPCEAVVPSHVAQAGGIHRAGQPLPAVQADLDGEGEPSLDARMHEAEDRMDLVVVEIQALAMTRPQLQMLGLAVADDVIRQAGFDRRQDADQALLDPVLPAIARARSSLLVALEGMKRMGRPMWRAWASDASRNCCVMASASSRRPKRSRKAMAGSKLAAWK